MPGRRSAAPPPASEPPSIQQTLLEYQAILENASVGILFTRDRKVLHCNPRCSDIFGWVHGALVGQPGTVFYQSAQDYEAIGQRAGPVLARGDSIDEELLMRRADGRPVLIHLRAKAINPRNTAEGTIWIFEDITERKRQDNQLRELLQRQQAILENASVSILFTRNGVVEHCNPHAEALFGWPAGTLLGQSASVLARDGSDYAAFGAEVGPRLARGELVDLERLTARRDGTLFWCRHLAKALPTDDGSQSTIWISEDRSEHRAAQQALAQGQRELEQRVEERTRELALINQQLQHEVNQKRSIEEHLRAEEARLRDLSEMSSDWFWEQDSEFRFTEMSRGLLDTRLDPARTLGKLRWELPIVGVSNAQWREHRHLLQTHQPFKNFIYQMETQPGELHWFSINGKPVFDKGVFRGYRGTTSPSDAMPSSRSSSWPTTTP